QTDRRLDRLSLITRGITRRRSRISPEPPAFNGNDNDCRRPLFLSRLRRIISTNAAPVSEGERRPLCYVGAARASLRPLYSRAVHEPTGMQTTGGPSRKHDMTDEDIRPPSGEDAKALGAFYTDTQIADFLVWWAI